ncbi:hypothetical protein EU96_1999 [Prochlorococcus marinus str. MIT 9302]|uniref:Uncharacterized protein n=1 Tax=Prochlorococcus marinus str. MIT 9302 TaxID=74545 RepID=A0A0A2A3S1_PROMR|nr:hypothetical protein EU96_1999 [Prochlorococcus marinus str. MIT 9302]
MIFSRPVLKKKSSSITFCLFLEIKKGCMNLIYNEFMKFLNLRKII